MKWWAVGFLALGLVIAVWTGCAGAQSTPIVTDTPTTQQKPSYDEYRLDELKHGARRSRNALIGTSAAAAVGAALLFPGLARQCFLIQRPLQSDELRCTTAGKALLGFGWPLFFGGMTGMIVTGIMLGVRKGKIRRLDDRIAYEKSRAVRWDPAASRFVF